MKPVQINPETTQELMNILRLNRMKLEDDLWLYYSEEANKLALVDLLNRQVNIINCDDEIGKSILYLVGVVNDLRDLSDFELRENGTIMIRHNLARATQDKCILIMTREVEI